MVLVLANHADERFEFAEVDSITEGRALWKKIAGNRGSCLSGFFIESDFGYALYKGDYVTDEC